MADILSFSSTEVDRLAATVTQTLHRGGVIAVPTETFYGLAVDPFDAQAVDRLLQVKGRGEGKPVLVLIGSLEQLPLLTSTVPPAAQTLIDACWPGPLTILFSARASLPANLTAGTGTIGVRLTACKPLAALLRRVGPVTGTSANRTAQPPAQTPQAVEAAIGGEIELIVDAGPTPGGLPSTVVDATGAVRILREGALGRARIDAALRAGGFSLSL